MKYFSRVVCSVLILFSAESRAFFDFFGYVADPLHVFSGNANPTYNFTVSFSAYCNSGCVGQDYRLALSDSDPGRQSPITGGTEPLQYPADELSQFLISAQYSQQSNQGSLIPGQWTYPNSSNSLFQTTTNGSVTGSFSFTFNQNRLKQLPAGTYNFSFYIVGEDMYGTLHLDSILVTIPIVVPELVQISGLEDVALDTKDLSGNTLDAQFGVCVFSNTGGVSIDFDGSSNPGSDFMLSKQGQCVNASDCVNYRMVVKTPSENRLNYRRQGHRPNKVWTASAQQDCGGQDNMTLLVKLKRNDLGDIDSGVYSDTMTVTVWAQ
ncbi:hypothetical protein [Endozoicomonas numazuensis]|uniref:Spore coat protein U domain-containing protein n=1 Tax=Endozoicomonas numazuensis TaxID=1137799 RepID=A0A081NLQ8_9GAMM|nr:hypothetical protein [Endozoicomonas numazuensis]KEQ19381.1 hypothetical protein GZ78_05320 [Endozoicomonas numazuensis]